MITKEQVDKAWKEWNDYKEKYFGGPGNGCDDYRDIPDEVFRKKRELEDKARKLQKEYDEAQHYVLNDVWKYRIELNWDINSIERTIFTKPFPDYYEMPIQKRMKYQTLEKYFDEQEEIVKEKYFTKERIEELKKIFIERIQESENPFNICCVDTDCGWNVTADQLFNLD